MGGTLPSVIQPTLRRYPLVKNDPLQAWDAADELLLKHVAALELAGKRVLIVHDHFGALTCSLEAEELTSYTDSFLSHRAIQLNSQGARSTVSTLDELTGVYDFVLLRFPKNLSYFEDILCRLTAHLRPGSLLICASMVKHLSVGVFPLLQKYIGETSTSLAEKKARLVFAEFEKEAVASPFPLSLDIPGLAHPFTNHSNLFSREKLDPGTKFLLQHLPEGPFAKVLDLGCGNGILGIVAQQRYPDAALTFSDESRMALQSAETNYRKFFPEGTAAFVWANCYEDQERDSLDLVLCNPPFHQETTVHDGIAWQMFVDARRALKVGGTLRVIGNSHLGYHLKLKRIFGRAKIVATNDKFMIVDAVKTPTQVIQ